MALAAARPHAAAAPSSRSACSSSSSPSAATSSSRSPTGRTSRPTSGRSSRGCSASTSSRTSRSAGSRPTPTRTLLPLAALLNGIGFVTISRLDRRRLRAQARIQSVWTAVGVGAFVLTLVVVRDVRIFERYRYTFAAPRRRASAAAARARRSAGDQRRAALGRDRPAELPAGRDREGAARRVLRRVPRRQARAARAGTRPHRPAAFVPSPSDLGPLLLAWGVSIARARVREGPRLVAAVLRGVRGDALHRDATRLRTSSARSCCSSIGAVRRVPARSATCRTASSTWIDPWPTRRTTGFQLVQSLVRVRLAAASRAPGSGSGSPRPDPERVDRLRVLRDRRGARAHRHGRRRRRVPAARRQRVPHRGPGRRARSRSCSPPASPRSSASRRSSSSAASPA